MEKYREKIKSALRFTPERMERIITNAHFRPYFAVDNGFVYVKESFNKKDSKIKTYTVYDAAKNEERPLFDHEKFAALLSAKTGVKQDPADISINVEKVYENNSVEFSLNNGARYLYAKGVIEELNPALPKGAVVSPDKTKAIAEIGGNLFLIKLPSMERVQLTEDGSDNSGYGIRYPGSSGFIRDLLAGVKAPAGVVWSPDSSRFMTYFMDISAVGDLTLVQSVPQGPKPVRPVVFKYKYALPGDRHVPMAMFYIYDLNEMQLKRVDATVSYAEFGMPLTPRVSMGGWSLEGNIAACYVMNREFTRADIFIIDPATGAAKKLFTESADTFLFFDTHHQLNAGGPETEDFSSRVFVISEKLGKLYWLSERAGQFDIYEYDLETAECRKLTQTDCCVRQLLHLDDEKRRLYFSASGREAKVNIYQRYIYYVDLETGKIVLLSGENGDHNAFFPENGDFFACGVSAYDEPPTNRVFNCDDGKPRCILCDADVSRLENIGFSYPIPFAEKGSDGLTEVYGVMFLPNDFDPQKKYPVIEYCYGGNQTTRVPQNFPETLNDNGFTPCFSDAGFVTVIVDGRGTPLRGKVFHDYCYNNMGDCAGLGDRAAAIKALCKKYPFLDGDRVGVWGHSGGGFATLHAMVDHPELYKVGVSTGGNHSQEIYNSIWSERYMGPYNTGDWEAQNAEYNVDRLEGKLLLIHGELDDNVHPASTLRVVDALIKADKDFDMLIMPNMHHTLREHDYYRRKIIEYFLENL